MPLNSLIVDRKEVASNDEYILSIDKYRAGTLARQTLFELTRLGDIVDIINGYAFKSVNYTEEGIRVIRITNVQKGEIIDDNPQFYPFKFEDEIKIISYLKMTY